MSQKPKTSKEVYEECHQEGMYIHQEVVDDRKISRMAELAKANEEVGIKLLHELKKGEEYMVSTMYKLYYDSIHQLVEAFILFDKLKSSNHQGLFALLIETHPELEFDWNFFEKVRTKRNGIQYYGQPVSYQDWKEIEVQISLYIQTLKKEIERKLADIKT